MRGCIINVHMVDVGVCNDFIRGSTIPSAMLDCLFDLFVFSPANVALLKSMQRAYGRLGIRLAG